MTSASALRITFWASLLAVLVAVALVLTWVDLTPQVGSDFFFSTDDPQFQASRQIGERFPAAGQILIRAVGEDIFAPTYLEAMRQLSDELLAIEGISAVQSLTHGPSKPRQVPQSPIWRRLLLGISQDVDEADATYRASMLIASLGDGDGSTEDAERRLIGRVEEVIAAHDVPSFSLEISGVPYVIELIRRHLSHDLRTFSLASLLIFGLLIALIYRSWRIVLGTLVTCLGACAVTLTLLQLLGKPIGLLTANIITIVFVLTLSHIVFLTANWQLERRRGGDSSGGIVRRAVSRTLNASFWCMVTTLLGFSSLLLANAKPLRELGFSGALGTAVAILVAYGLYPAFLGGQGPRVGGTDDRSRPFPLSPGRLTLVGLIVVVVAFGSGVRQIDTDPNLLSYFAPESELRHGLEMIDRSGGSSPLLFVVTTPDGGPFDQKAELELLASVQQRFDADPAVGTALSLPVLVEEARRNPLAMLLPLGTLFNILDSPDYGHILRSFLSDDRQSALLFLRMREVEREEPRQVAIDRLRQMVLDEGLEVELSGGLFELQAQLGDLVARSLITGLAGLFGLFALIAAVVSRSLRITLAMVLALLPIPLLLLGGFGHLGQPVDIISSPAANVAIALGIDSMIHLVMTVRRRRADGDGWNEAWQTARHRLWQPIVGAMLILATGFGIFALSSFPPTQRFGSGVAFGTLAAAFMALVLLPTLATVKTSNAP